MLDNSHRGFLAAVVVAAVVFVGCADETPTDPSPDPTLTVTPGTQWAGGTVQATSEAFGSAPFAITLDGDTLAVSPAGENTVDVTLPNPRLTGPATLALLVDGEVLSEASLEIVGAARMPVAVESATCDDQFCAVQVESGAGPYHLAYHGAGLPTGELLAYYRMDSSGFGLASLDGAVPTATVISGLEIPFVDYSGLVAPGLGVQAGSWLLEASTPDSAAPLVRWSFSPAGVATSDTVGCLGSGIEGGYMVAELPSGDCLVLTAESAPDVARFSINGVTPVPGYDAIAPPWQAGCVGFRGAPGNEWIALRSLNGFTFCENVGGDTPPPWPVFASDGSVAFSSDRYVEWPKGADFTPAGDTLWVVGETANGWSLDAWDPRSGQMISEMVIDGAEACWDARVDAHTPRIYVACKFFDVPPETDQRWPSLVVFDREVSDIVAVLHTPGDGFIFPVVPPFELVHSVSTGTLHLTSVWDGTTAPTDRGLQIASWNVFSDVGGQD